MNEQQQNTRDWHIKFRVLVQDQPGMPDMETRILRADLIDEEAKELREAILANDIVKTADALGDLLYVVYGSAVSFGIDLEPIFAEIHRSNMSKGDPDVVKAPNGKILKSANYTPPDLWPIIFRQLGEKAK